MRVPASATATAGTARLLLADDPTAAARGIHVGWLLRRVLLALAILVPLELLATAAGALRAGTGITPGRFAGFVVNVGASALLAVFVFWGAERWPLWGERWRAVHWLLHGALLAGCLLFLGLTAPLVNGAGPPEPTVGLYLRLLPGTMYLYMVTAALGTSFLARDQWSEAADRSSVLAAQLSQAQLSVLRSQLHPHFLFNTLNAIAELVHTDREGAVRVVHQLGAFLRYSMEVSGVTEVPLRQEIAALQAFLDIVRVRFGDRAVTATSVDAAALDVRVPPLLLQPLVENAVKHGFERMEGQGWLEVSGWVEGGRLRLEVTNGGTGLTPPAGGRPGIGIRNTRARLHQLYGDGAELALHPRQGGGFTAAVTLPVRVAGRAAALA